MNISLCYRSQWKSLLSPYDYRPTMYCKICTSFRECSEHYGIILLSAKGVGFKCLIKKTQLQNRKIKRLPVCVKEYRRHLHINTILLGIEIVIIKVRSSSDGIYVYWDDPTMTKNWQFPPTDQEQRHYSSPMTYTQIQKSKIILKFYNNLSGNIRGHYWYNS